MDPYIFVAMDFLTEYDIIGISKVLCIIWNISDGGYENE